MVVTNDTFYSLACEDSLKTRNIEIFQIQFISKPSLKPFNFLSTKSSFASLPTVLRVS